jgi:hypothetical protein
MPLTSSDRENFQTLIRAFSKGDVALLECQLVSTGQLVATICAVERHDDGSCSFVPFAQMFSGNPYTQVNPPLPGQDHFATQEEV